MLYLGIDQHARQITISLRDDSGDVLQARQVSRNSLIAWLPPAATAPFPDDDTNVSESGHTHDRENLLAGCLPESDELQKAVFNGAGESPRTILIHNSHMAVFFSFELAPTEIRRITRRTIL